MTHLKRNHISGLEFLFSLEMGLTTQKEKFLLCKKNKARFVNALSDCLRGKGLKTIQAKAYADLLIVFTVVECLKTLDTVVIGDDTGLLVLLLYHCIPEHHKIYLHSQCKSTTSGATWDIEAIVKKIGTETCKLLRFTHVILGFDTASHHHGFGKGIALKRLRDNKQFLGKCFNVFKELVLQKKRLKQQEKLHFLYCRVENLLTILTVTDAESFSRK